MATVFSRKNVDSVVRVLVKQYNALHEDTVASDGYVHSDISGVPGGTWEYPTSSNLQVSAADASSLTTLCNLTYNLIGVFNQHLGDDCAHRVANLSLQMDDTDGYVSLPTTLLECEDLLNSLHLRYNSHRSASEGGVAVHLNSDALNATTAAAATNQATSETLANEIKTDLNAHIIRGPSVGKIKLIDG